MKHDQIVSQLLQVAGRDPNIAGRLLFGSVATGAHRPDSDVDVITILVNNNPAWGIDNAARNGLKVGDIFFTVEVLAHSVETVPYLLHPLAEAKLLFDRDGSIAPIQEQIRTYFAYHPELVDEWHAYYRQLKEEKARYGYDKTTIVDVWNELEMRHSGGQIRRRFFNAFYLTSPRIFSILKRFL